MSGNTVYSRRYIYIYNICVCVCLFVQGLGTDEETLMEILCTRSGKQLQEISAAYTYCKSLFPPSLSPKQNLLLIVQDILVCILIFVLLFAPCFSV